MDWKPIIAGVVIGAIVGITGTFFALQGRISKLEGIVEQLSSGVPQAEKERSLERTAVSEEQPVTARETETQSRPQVQLLNGTIDSSPRWGSGWLDLATVMDFAAGDVLRLRIGGTARKVLVRLLPEGHFPDSSVGILGGAVTVPENRIVEVILDRDRIGIIQLSVHGGPNPWGKFPLGGGNGPATLESVELVRP